ncbi:MAG: NPCBM/NEW2 domain-containing protein [Acidobacteriota bacterium]|nr:NPCBM/NEW2 domain-containing protein [Acidobacteriota bacterium]
MQRTTRFALLSITLLVTCFLISPPGSPEALKRVASAQGSEVYLSDLSWASATNGWGPVERDMSNGDLNAGDGLTITLNGVAYPKGLGAHGNSEIVYNLGGAYTNFITDVGVDDEVGANGTVTFEVWADGVQLYDSGQLAGSSPTRAVNVGVVGRQQLKLVITTGCDNDWYDHADWAGARLVRNQTPTVTYLSDITWSFVRNGWGPVERDMSNGGHTLGDGATLVLNGVPYPKGLGTHADSEIVYNLGGNSSTFISDIGLDDEVGPNGSVRFQVYGDAALLYDSGVMNGSSQTQFINVSVAGRQQLRLVVSMADGNRDYDHADWGAARVIGNAPPKGPTPSVSGHWGPLTSWPIVAVHTSVLPNGKVLAWDADVNRAQIRVWDPCRGTFTGNLPTPGNRTNVFCSGHAFLADGRLLAAGGQISTSYNEGTPHSNIFDFNTNTWSASGNMNAGRWYPSNVTLGTGEVLTLSGLMENQQINSMPQVWSNGTWRNLGGAAPYAPALYPWLHVTPGGTVFVSGPTQATSYLSTAGSGSRSSGPGSNYGFRDYGSAVMYDDSKVLIVGGAGDQDVNPPANTAEVIDLNSPAPSWRYVSPMAFGRRQLNATVLPDGKVLVTGGTGARGFNDSPGTEAVYAAELWDPEAGGDGMGRWATLAPMRVQRVYHSTAVLLPDGRVLSAGGGQFGGAGPADNHLDAEIFYPPYLFKGARPTITRVTTRVAGAVGYGETFAVETPNASAVTKVTWLPLGSVTHAFNQNQRINRLAFTRTTGALSVTAPTNRNVCPPGYYMLFILNGSGVPSVAKLLKVGGAPGGDTYLSDLAWASATNGWGPVERDMSNGDLNAGDGLTITLNGVAYGKGLGAHANSDIVYNLGGGYARFITDVGVDDEVGANGSVRFFVYGDGALLYDSGVMTGNSPTQNINVGVAGVQQLRLVVNVVDNDWYDHADWAGARLTR